MKSHSKFVLSDPPKVVPDVVEALIGAVHVDSGLNNGQNAALHVIAPLLQSLSHLLAHDSSTGLGGLLHPKQNLYEISGGIVSVRVYKKDKYDQLGFPPMSNFGNQCNDVGGYVGVVRCKQVLIATALESSKLAAINVSCELAVQILKEDKFNNPKEQQSNNPKEDKFKNQVANIQNPKEQTVQNSK